jgi:hypothetical protein
MRPIIKSDKRIPGRMPVRVTRKVHMQDSPLSVPDAATRLFDNYLNCLIKASIPEKQRRWYVKRVENSLRPRMDRKLNGSPALISPGTLR